MSLSSSTSYRDWVAALVVALIVFAGGYSIGQAHPSAVSQVTGVSNMDSSGVATSTDFSIFWKTWNILNDQYIATHSTTTPSDQEKVYGAIEGLAASYGDPYTVFFPPADTKDFKDQISGSFEGVGMEVDVKDGVLTVVAPLKNTPAERAGIKSGDQIITIDKKSTQGLATEEAIALIKGPKGTTVNFTIIREDSDKPVEIAVVRDTIETPTIETKTIGSTFIIQLYSFSGTSPNLFRDALRQFIQSGKTNLVIDLRGNPGGYLEAAVDMASWFLPSGKVVVSEKAKNPEDSQDYRSKGYDIFNDNLRLAILIDGGSASASEILAGALHDHKEAILIGAKSYGKGSVQELVPITSDTALKVTVARWYTPNGISISNNGLLPDVPITFNREKFLANGTDTQLNRAIEVLNNTALYASAQAGELASSTAVTSATSTEK